MSNPASKRRFRRGSPTDLEELRYLAEIVGAASLCGLGRMAGGPINSASTSWARS